MHKNMLLPKEGILRIMRVALRRITEEALMKNCFLNLYHLQKFRLESGLFVSKLLLMFWLENPRISHAA